MKNISYIMTKFQNKMWTMFKVTLGCNNIEQIALYSLSGVSNSRLWKLPPTLLMLSIDLIISKEYFSVTTFVKYVY